MEVRSGVYKEPLLPHHIRLVLIRRGTWDSEIDCELFHLDIDAPEIPRYRALSYVWGLPTRDSPHILVEGHRHKVTFNLEYALKCLRDESEPVMLWVDAIVSTALWVCVRARDLD